MRGLKNPFSKITDNVKRRKRESYVRSAVKMIGAVLVARGTLKVGLTEQFVDIATGFVMAAIALYQSNQSIEHTENVIAVAQVKAPDTPRPVLEAEARRLGSMVGS